MTPEQLWQVAVILIGLNIGMVAFLWTSMHKMVGKHGSRISDLERNALKREEFNGFAVDMRHIQTRVQENIARLETEMNLRAEYSTAQGVRLEAGMLRLEALLRTGSKQ
jgi:hypothetical protein